MSNRDARDAEIMRLASVGFCASRIARTIGASYDAVKQVIYDNSDALPKPLSLVVRHPSGARSVRNAMGVSVPYVPSLYGSLPEVNHA